MEDFYAHIDAYKQGTLKGKLLLSFEKEMKQNESLRLAVQNYEAARDISEGLLELDMLETLAKLKMQSKTSSRLSSDQSDDMKVIDLKKSASKAPEINSNRNWKKWIAAASVIVFISISGWWLMDYRSEQQYIAYVQENYDYPEDRDATKSVDTVGMTDFEKGKFYFGLNQFEVSRIFLEKHLSRETDPLLRSEGYEWLGAVYVKLEMMDKVKEALKKSREERAIRNMKLMRMQE